MADKKMTFGIGIKTTYDASGINKLKADLTNLSTLGKNVEILGGKSSVEEISKAVTAANTLKNALKLFKYKIEFKEFSICDFNTIIIGYHYTIGIID